MSDDAINGYLTACKSIAEKFALLTKDESQEINAEKNIF